MKQGRVDSAPTLLFVKRVLDWQARKRRERVTMSRLIPKSMQKDLRDEVNRVLKLFAEWTPDSSKQVYLGDPVLTEQAMQFLQDFDLMEFRETGEATHVRLTAQGYAYWEEINTFAPWYWFKRNWFPAIVAAATIAASVTGAIANFAS